MINTRSKLAWALAGGYALLVALALLCRSTMPESLVAQGALGVLLLLTFPWSFVVMLLGFMLIHISSHGLEYGFIIGALINTVLIFFIVSRLRGKR
jgi:uncharacterized membrane protein required for colicin V production